MNEILNKLSIDKMIRYSYTGFLLIILSVIFNKSEILPIIKDLGAGITIVFGLTIGAFLFTIYRYIIGELFLYWLVHIVHWIIELPFKEKVNIFSFVFQKKISVFKSRIVYNYLRRSFFNEQDRKKYDFAHSEIHLVYITSIVLFIIYLYIVLLLELKEGYSTIVLLTSIVLLIAGIIMDIQQHRIEIRKLKYDQDDEEINEILKKIGVK